MCKPHLLTIILPHLLPPPPIPPPPLQFKAWLARHGPFGAVIDGANVALYGQNFETGGFTLG